ncbi:MAG: LytTR family DNA-binding domain-containing protein [Eubacteriales bacterium]|nr:LytTR family DNA-binding domain-containing protein [Eubacteriales bacterium]
MRILICDDEEACIHHLQECVEQYMIERNIPFDIVEAIDPYNILTSKDVFDIAFLDIQMGSVDGLTLAKELRRRNRRTALFFVTNYEGYQDNAMDLQALRYYTKPFNKERLIAGLDKALEYIDGAYVDIFLYSSGVQQRVLVDDILYLTLEGRKVAVQTKYSCFLVAGKLDDWKEYFPHTFFRQPHKSYIVNLHHVNQYTYAKLIMSDGLSIPVAPKKQPEFRKAWFEYIGR